MENEEKEFVLLKHSLNGQMTSELKEANDILQKVVKKYKLKFGDLGLTPFPITPFGSGISLAVMVDRIFDNLDISSLSALAEEIRHNEKSA
jgi:hypothetical protein